MPVRISSGGGARRRRRHSLAGTVLLSVSLLASAFVLTRHKAEPPKQAPAPAIVAEYDVVEVPVPVKTVPAGTRVKEIDLRLVRFPKHQLPPGALQDLAGMQEAVTKAVLPANLPLFPENFSMAAGHHNPVIEQIPAGMRAITLRVDATSSVEGWAGSGTIVDVLLVEKDRSSVIAERVKVLSAERVVSPIEGSSAPTVPTTVTLLVTQDQALAISTAVPRGRIAFALRNLEDEQGWNEKNYTAERLHGRRPDKVSSPIRGYASVRTENGEKRFALSDNAWVRSEVVPEGFMVGQE